MQKWHLFEEKEITLEVEEGGITARIGQWERMSRLKVRSSQSSELETWNVSILTEKQAEKEF